MYRYSYRNGSKCRSRLMCAYVDANVHVHVHVHLDVDVDVYGLFYVYAPFT